MGLYEVMVFVHVTAAVTLLSGSVVLVVLASGIYLTSVANFWAQGWVLAAIAFWLVNAVVAGVVVKPVIGHVVAAAATATDGPVDLHLDTFRRSSRWSVGGDVLMANDIAMLYVMTMKPDLAGSLLAVAGTILAIGAVRVITRGLHGFIVSRHSVEPPGRAARL